MSLQEQQHGMLRLCLERDYRSLFQQLKGFRESVARSLNEPLFLELELESVVYQANAIDELLLNDYKANLHRTCGAITDLHKVYADYRTSFPYRFDNKFQEYLRFLGFLVLFSKDAQKKDVQDVINYEYCLFACTLKRERLRDALEFIIKNRSQTQGTGGYIINPSIVLGKVVSTGYRNIFFFADEFAKISIAEADPLLGDFIETKLNVIILEDELSKVLSKVPTVTKKDLVDFGLIFEIHGR